MYDLLVNEIFAGLYYGYLSPTRNSLVAFIEMDADNQHLAASRQGRGAARGGAPPGGACDH